MKAQLPQFVFAFPPHLKNTVTFEPQLICEFLGTLIFILAACFLGGMSFVKIVGVVLLATLVGDLLLQAIGFTVKPRWDLSLYHQALLLALFLPVTLPLPVVAGFAASLVFFYRFSGGRSGYVLPPVCLVLALMQGLGYAPQLSLIPHTPFLGGVILILWLGIRFPKTMIEIRRMADILVLAVLFSILHEMVWFTALIWSAIACELIFDPAVMPLTKKGRIQHQVLSLALGSLFLAVTTPVEAVIYVPLISGFLSGWIETRSLTQKVYATKTH